MSARPAREVLAALRDLGRAERDLIESGRIEALEALADQRSSMVTELQTALAAAPADQELAGIIATLRDEGTRNVALLKSLQADIVRQIENDERASRAVGSYAGSARL
jgi:hypothetical protein